MWYNYCSFTVVIAEAKMSLKKDRHFLIAKLGDQAELECCCGGPENMNFTWLVCTHGGKLTKCIPSPVNSTEDISINASFTNNVHCGTISFKSVTLNDTGMYLCLFSQGIHSYGTYLHVYGKCLCVCYDVRWAMQISLVCQQGRVSNRERWSQLSSKRC